MLGGGSRERLPLELGEADPTQHRRRSGEADIDQLGRETERVEELRAPVGRDVGDPHPRHRLQDAVLDRDAEAELRLTRRRAVAAELVRSCQRREGLEREARTDRVRSIAEEAGEVVALARLVAEDDERAARAQSLLEQTLLDCAERQQ